MFSKYLSGIQDVSAFAVVAFILFFAFFLFVLVWVVTTNKQYFDIQKQIPFSEDEIKSIKNEKSL